MIHICRLNLTNTVMSKRKLTWLVDEKVVGSWEDPRLPTVRGVLRRGLTVEALKMFILAQGSSRSVVYMEWDKIWAMNKKVIDPVAPRFTTVDQAYYAEVRVKGAKVESVQADKHPKDPQIGQKTVWRGPTVLIDGIDAEALKEGENTTFINWGNLVIDKVHKENGKVVAVDATPNLDNRDFKKTLKVTWLAKVDKPEAAFTPAVCVHFDHIISKPVLDKNDDFKDFVNKNSQTEIAMLGDPELRSLKKGDIIQIQRRGFFIVDRPYAPVSPNTCKPCPIKLIAIPDGTPDSYGPPGKKASTAPTATAATGGAKKKADKEASKEVKKEAPKKEKSPVTNSSPSGASGGWSAKAVQLNDDITAQGDKVRKLKGEKAEKEAIDTAVQVLLGLKTKFKAETGQDWKPNMKAPVAAGDNLNADALNDQILEQGNKVRDLKGQKADKSTIEASVATLLDLKAKYKTATGKDWKPGCHQPSAPTPAANSNNADELNQEITSQGNKVRDLKTNKAEKAAVDAAVAVLLQLKAKYKESTGQDWKPGCHKASSKQPSPVKESSPASTNSEGDSLNAQIADQGSKVRDLKTKKADKAEIDAAVAILLDLKAKYKAATGQDWKPAGGGDGGKKADSKKSGDKKKKEDKKPKDEKKPAPKSESAGGPQKVTR